MRDRPREGDDPARARWYGEHVRREDAIDAQRRKRAPDVRPERWRANWYQRRGVPRDQQPAPFSVDKARTIPDYQDGDRTRARLDVRGGPDVHLSSGHGGGEIMRRFKDLHGGRLPRELGFVGFNYHHVEAQAAAYMRMTRRREATLYLNNEPCADPPDGCDRVLHRMLPSLGVFPGRGVRVARFMQVVAFPERGSRRNTCGAVAFERGGWRVQQWSVAVSTQRARTLNAASCSCAWSSVILPSVWAAGLRIAA